MRRRETRETRRVEDERQALEREQDGLLAAARAHNQAGDLERAVQTFRRLLAPGGAIRAELERAGFRPGAED